MPMSYILGAGIDHPIMLEDVELNPPLIITLPFDDGDQQTMPSNLGYIDSQDNMLLYDDGDNYNPSISSNMDFVQEVSTYPLILSAHGVVYV